MGQVLLLQRSPTWPAERIKAAITETLRGENQIKAILDAYNPHRHDGRRGGVNFTTSKGNCAGKPARTSPMSTGVVCDSDWEAEFARVARPTRASCPTSRTRGWGSRCPTSPAPPAKYIPGLHRSGRRRPP